MFMMMIDGDDGASAGKLVMTLMTFDDGYKIPLMADDEVLVVVCTAPKANQDKQAQGQT